MVLRHVSYTVKGLSDTNLKSMVFFICFRRSIGMVSYLILTNLRRFTDCLLASAYICLLKKI